MLIREVINQKGSVESLNQKQFVIKEILESEEVSHGLINPNHSILYEKVEWRKITLLAKTHTVIEKKVKTEEFIKVIKSDRESSSSKCLKVYLLTEEQTIDSVIKEIQRIY